MIWVTPDAYVAPPMFWSVSDYAGIIAQSLSARCFRLTLTVDTQGNVLFVRFYEGEGANAIYKSNGDLPRLLQSLVDVPLIVNTMPQAIRRAVMQASQ